jgi:uncharacterized membrane protein
VEQRVNLDQDAFFFRLGRQGSKRHVVVLIINTGNTNSGEGKNLVRFQNVFIETGTVADLALGKKQGFYNNLLSAYSQISVYSIAIGDA